MRRIRNTRKMVGLSAREALAMSNAMDRKEIMTTTKSNLCILCVCIYMYVCNVMDRKEIMTTTKSNLCCVCAMLWIGTRS
jgi:hypothetical protein